MKNDFECGTKSDFENGTISNDGAPWWIRVFTVGGHAGPRHAWHDAARLFPCARACIDAHGSACAAAISLLPVSDSFIMIFYFAFKSATNGPFWPWIEETGSRGERP